MTITGQQVIDAVDRENVIFAQKKPEQRQLMEHYLGNDFLPALENLLDEPASAELILKAQLENYRQQSKVELPRRMLELVLLPSDQRFAQVVAAMNNRFDQIIAQLETVVANPAMVQKSEQAYLRSLPLSFDNYQKIQARKMTVGELLLDQPRIILEMGRTPQNP
ncbi:MAG: hypothetical protein V1738_04825 [Patescibacteria group bacterium]